MGVVKIIKSDNLVGGLPSLQGTIHKTDEKISSKYTISSKELEFKTVTVVLENIDLGTTGGLNLEINGVKDRVMENSEHTSRTYTLDKEFTSMSLTPIKSGTATIGTVMIYGGNYRPEYISLPVEYCIEKKRGNLAGWSIECYLDISFKEHIQQGYIAMVETKSKGLQPFRIHNPEIVDREVHFIANHVIFDTENYLIKSVNLTTTSGASAIQQLNDGTDRESPFKVFSTVEGALAYDFRHISYLEALQILIKNWGGIIDPDGFKINFREDMGRDDGVYLSYGVDLEGIRVFEDWNHVTTKLFPTTDSGEFTLPESFISSNLQYTQEYARHKDFSLNIPDEKKEDIAYKTELLRETAQAYLATQDKPKLAYQISSNVRQDLDIWDTVRVKHPALTDNIDVSTGLGDDNVFIPVKVVGYEYNVLTKRVINLEYGDNAIALNNTYSAIVKEVDEKISSILVDQEGLLKEQTSIINNLNKNGHVVIEDNEILLLDRLPKEEAQTVWKLGVGGIGVSSSGVGGEFVAAWDLENGINADFITGGTIRGSLLEVASIRSDHLSVEAKEMLINLAKGGGNNLISNSVMWGGVVPPWTGTAVGSLVGISNSWALEGESNFAIVPQQSSRVFAEQVIIVPDAEYFTFLARVSKTAMRGQLTLEVQTPISGTWKNLYRKHIPTGEIFSGNIKEIIPSALVSGKQIRIRIEANDSSMEVPPMVSDMMLASGNANRWESHVGELYNNSFAMDQRGFSVIRRDPVTGVEIGKTVMSPEEFAGYNGDTRIFTLNGDITEAMGIEIIEKGLFIRPIKMVQNLDPTAPSLDIVWTGIKGGR